MKILNALKKGSQYIFNISMALIFAMMCFMTLDALLQVIVGAGILGNYEIVEISIIEINELSGEELANWQTVAGEITQDWITELNNAGYDGKTVVDTVKTLAEKYAP